jgi:AmmeMemoRadiSam system protein B
VIRVAPLLLGLAGCAGVTVVPGTYPGDPAMWQRLVAAPERLAVEGRPVAAIAPHHLIDGPELAAFWSALAEAAPAPVVVVIGPDHRARGGGEVTVADGVRFDTAFGEMMPDAELVEALRRQAPVSTRDLAFGEEHAIHVHVPFVKHFLPKARLLPLIVQWGSDPKTLDAVAFALDRVLPADALLVASVDFSHFQSQRWATFHDEPSWATIAGFELKGLFDREVDSPESLYVAMRFAALRGARKATRVLHTNSQGKRATFMPDSTSHQYVTFTKGELASAPSVSVMITGEVAASAGLRLREDWRWRSFVPAATPVEPRLSQVRGQEDRFFMGADAYLFRLEPGEREERTIHGLRAVFAAVELGSDEAAGAQIARLKGTADCLFLLAWRGSASAEIAAARAATLSDAGADVVIGRGFGAPRELEYRGDRIVALSLGELLPDRPVDAAGAVLGVTWTPLGIRARVIPLRVVAGVPMLDLDRVAEDLGYERAGPPNSRE